MYAGGKKPSFSTCMVTGLSWLLPFRSKTLHLIPTKSENNPKAKKKNLNTPHPQMKCYKLLEKRVENRTRYYAL